MSRKQGASPGKSGGSRKQQLRRAAALEQAVACERARQFPQAEQIYLGLLRDDARDAEAGLRLAELYRATGRGEQALPILSTVAALERLAPATLNMLGIAWHRLGCLPEAKQAFERALQLRAGAVDVRYNLGLVLRDLGQAREAGDCFAKVLDARPDNPQALLQFGIALREAHRLQAALEVFQRVATAAPGSAEVQRYLALTYVDLGQIDAAIRCWEKALELEPNCSLSHLRLSHLRKRGHDIAALEAAHARATQPADRIHIAFALGKALEDAGEYDRAFGYLLEGNQLKRRQFRYSLDEWRAFFDELKDIFDADFLQQQAEAGVQDDTPIFIVGMPRSGSSLVEQILASHSAVFGAGELKLLPQLCADGARRRGRPFPGYFREMSESDWAGLGREYLDALRQRSPDTPRITDKLPENFRFIGAIHCALPRARIVHCRRDPLDNCWSMFKNLFAEGHPYCYDLEELGRFYRYYQDLMQHWHAVLPGSIYDVDYEKLVADPEREIAALLAWCQLPFEQRCVDFHRNERAVATMSAAQVKQPIHRDSVASWTHFRGHLEPLVRQLGL